jgi:hypothetical protein
MTPDDKRRVAVRLQRAFTEPRDPKEWAWRLKAREERGEQLSTVQRTFWREALQRELAQPQEAS